MSEAETSERTVCYRHPKVDTGVTCTDCGRPICPDCMSFGPVGIRCPDCSGAPTGAKKTVSTVRNVGARAPVGSVANVLIAINVIVFVAMLAAGSDLTRIGGRIAEEGVLFGPLVADGEWWRLLTAAFLHNGLIHIAFNMLFLWWFGRALESLLGPGRFIAIYLVSALAGSAGALLLSPDKPTVGASGAVFGILGAGLVLERSRVYVFGGQAMFVIVINLALSFVLSNISVGGHIGGVVGGALAMLVLNHFGRQVPLSSRNGLAAMGSLAGLAILSAVIAIAYARSRGFA